MPIPERAVPAAKKSLLVGVIGHVDHGKTALVRALTGTDTDRLKEEKQRGVSIVPGFALLRPAGPEGGEIDLIDLPGHERFVRAMISGATGMRAVLLAVDAREGLKPQTIEHLEIARLIGVRRGVVALTKCDLVGPEAVAARTAEVSAVAARAGLDDVRVIATSVVAGTGLSDLTAALAGLLGEAPAASDDGFPYLPLDRVFARPGFGTVVTGTLRRGRLTVGDRVAVMPGGTIATVRGLQIHGRPVQSAELGRRTAVALRGVELAELQRGQALAAPDLLEPGRGRPAPERDAGAPALRHGGGKRAAAPARPRRAGAWSDGSGAGSDGGGCRAAGSRAVHPAQRRAAGHHRRRAGARSALAPPPPQRSARPCRTLGSE